MIYRLPNRIFLLLFTLISLFASGQKQLVLDEDGLPRVPAVQTSVYDYAGIFPGDAEKMLEQKLIRYSDTTGTQIVVATVPSLRGEDITFYGTNWAHKWGIGQKGEDNGIFIIIAPKERKTAIITGYGVEDRLTDALARRIIEKVMIPAFKKGDYIGGVNRATDVIFSILQGKFKKEELSQQNSDEWLYMLVLFFFLFIIIFWLSRKYGNGHGDGGYTIDRPGPIFWGGGFGGGSSGGGFGGFGGGGFSGGFGGGGFGGGGASGSW